MRPVPASTIVLDLIPLDVLSAILRSVNGPEEKDDVDDDGNVIAKVEESEPEKELDPFLASIPTDLTTADCIVEVDGANGQFKTIDEQHEFFVKKMRRMARQEHDEEDGWAFYSRVEPEGVDVFERQVDWSPVSQLRSRWTARCGVDTFGEYAWIVEHAAKAFGATSEDDNKAVHDFNVNQETKFVFLQQSKDISVVSWTRVEISLLLRIRLIALWTSCTSRNVRRWSTEKS